MYTGVYTYKISGTIYHTIGSLLPIEDRLSEFAQIYFYDTLEEQLQSRLDIITNMNSEMLSKLQFIIHSINPFVSMFKQSLEFRRENGIQEITLPLICDSDNNDIRKYNLEINL